MEKSGTRWGIIFLAAAILFQDVRIHFMWKRVEEQDREIIELARAMDKLAEASQTNSQAIVTLGQDVNNLSEATIANSRSILTVAKARQ